MLYVDSINCDWFSLTGISCNHSVTPELKFGANLLLTRKKIRWLPRDWIEFLLVTDSRLVW